MIKASVMREIKDRIATEEQWIQCNAWRARVGKDGKFLRDEHGDIKYAFCIDGAIMSVAQQKKQKNNDEFVYEYEQFIAKIIGEMYPTYSNWEYADNTIFSFNDCDKRSWAEIDAVMDKAVVRAEEVEGLLGEGE